MKNIIITGSKGRIGTVLANALNNEFNVHGIDVADSDEPQYAKADISDFASLNVAFEKLPRADLLIHMAGRSGVQWDWDSILKSNIIGTRNVYECARLYGVKRIVLASSNHATGGYEGIPPVLHLEENPRMITVHDPICPDSDYGSGKAFAEALARQYFEQYSIESICLRIGTVRPDDNPGKDPRLLKTWLSQRDLVQLVRKSLQAEVKFGIYYGVSDNTGRFWDISNAEEELGYHPLDNASKL